MDEQRHENVITPEPALRFVSRGNARFHRGTRKKLAHLSEVRENVANQIGMPAFAPSKTTSALLIFTSVVAIAGPLAGISVFVLVLRWGMIVLSGFIPSADEICLLPLALVFAAILLAESPRSANRVHLQLQYLPCVTQVVEELMASGQMIPCEVCEIEHRVDSRSLIRYRFVNPDTGTASTGEYLTRSKAAFSPGNTMVVLYLDQEIHVLL